MKHMSAAFIAAALFAAPAFADEMSDVETFMTNYLVAWNAHDASAITTKYYRLDSAHPWSTEQGMKAEFDRLKADGYDRSDISSIKGCVLTPDTAQAEIRYVRLRTDGSFMPPRDRASIYRLRKFADGWRVIGFAGLAPDKHMDCPAS